MFHYARGEDLLPYSHAHDPHAHAAGFEALDFAKRTADICAHWVRKTSGAAPGDDVGAALDLGCAVGRSSFELSRLGFARVVGLDFSHAFVAACERMRALPPGGAGGLPFSMQVEGEVFKTCEARLPAGCAPARCQFVQGDACALDVPALQAMAGGAGRFRLVHAANLLCRLPDPAKLLAALPHLVAPRGLVVFFSPYSWLKQYTPRDKWLGARAGAGEKRSAQALAHAMGAHGFKLVHEEDVPFLIREHARKFQLGFAHCTVFERIPSA